MKVLKKSNFETKLRKKIKFGIFKVRYAFKKTISIIFGI